MKHVLYCFQHMTGVCNAKMNSLELESETRSNTQMVDTSDDGRRRYTWKKDTTGDTEIPS
jgi:hypothetical protein